MPGIGGTFGADMGTLSVRLSLTDLSLGIPPANKSPNCGTARGAPGPALELVGAEAAGLLEDIEAETFRSRRGFDLSTVTAFLSLIPLWISPKRASLPPAIGGGEERLGTPIGGGGGGGGPAIVV